VYRRFVWRRLVEETFCRGYVLYVRRRTNDQGASGTGIANTKKNTFSSETLYLRGLFVLFNPVLYFKKNHRAKLCLLDLTHCLS
jgi:hypothetical protein